MKGESPFNEKYCLLATGPKHATYALTHMASSGLLKPTDAASLVNTSTRMRESWC